MLRRNKAPRITRKVYFPEKRKSGETRYYIGKVIGSRELVRRSGEFMGVSIGQQREWTDISLLIETSDRRRISVWLTETFEVESEG